MSIEDMCTGSTVVKQVETAATGDAFGKSFTHTDGASLDCNAQTMSANESLKYGADGESRFWQLFFSSNPSIAKSNRLKLTVHEGVTLSPAKFLRVKATYSEGRPNEALLWIVDAEEEPLRNES